VHSHYDYNLTDWLIYARFPAPFVHSVPCAIAALAYYQIQIQPPLHWHMTYREPVAHWCPAWMHYSVVHDMIFAGTGIIDWITFLLMKALKKPGVLSANGNALFCHYWTRTNPPILLFIMKPIDITVTSSQLLIYPVASIRFFDHCWCHWWWTQPNCCDWRCDQWHCEMTLQPNRQPITTRSSLDLLYGREDPLWQKLPTLLTQPVNIIKLIVMMTILLLMA